MIKKYNKKQHLKLLNQRFLGIISKEEELELDEYFSILLWQADWKARNDYLELIEKFKNGKLTSKGFCNAFLKRADRSQNIAKILESNLDLVSDSCNKKLVEFGKLINSIVINCICYSSDDNLSDKNKGITLLDIIEKKYVQIRTIVNEED